MTPLEYTDAPEIESSEQPLQTPTAASGLFETAEGKASDLVAVTLSVVPGLGHVYKGYRVIGVLLIFIGTPLAVGAALLIATGTAGFGFFLLPIYWIAVMIHVWAIPDQVAPTISDEGEQYDVEAAVSAASPPRTWDAERRFDCGRHARLCSAAAQRTTAAWISSRISRSP